MKKILFTITLLFVLILNVSAADITMENLIENINNGRTTANLIQASKDAGEDYTLVASYVGDILSIDIKVGTTEYTRDYKYDSDLNIIYTDQPLSTDAGIAFSQAFIDLLFINWIVESSNNPEANEIIDYYNKISSELNITEQNPTLDEHGIYINITDTDYLIQYELSDKLLNYIIEISDYDSSKVSGPDTTTENPETGVAAELFPVVLLSIIALLILINIKNKNKIYKI